MYSKFLDPYGKSSNQDGSRERRVRPCAHARVLPRRDRQSAARRGFVLRKVVENDSLCASLSRVRAFLKAFRQKKGLRRHVLEQVLVDLRPGHARAPRDKDRSYHPLRSASYGISCAPYSTGRASKVVHLSPPRVRIIRTAAYKTSLSPHTPFYSMSGP